MRTTERREYPEAGASHILFEVLKWRIEILGHIQNIILSASKHRALLHLVGSQQSSQYPLLLWLG
jgi:hypothetical protein